MVRCKDFLFVLSVTVSYNLLIKNNTLLSKQRRSVRDGCIYRILIIINMRTEYNIINAPSEFNDRVTQRWSTNNGNNNNNDCRNNENDNKIPVVLL